MPAGESSASDAPGGREIGAVAPADRAGAARAHGAARASRAAAAACRAQTCPAVGRWRRRLWRARLWRANLGSRSVRRRPAHTRSGGASRAAVARRAMPSRGNLQNVRSLPPSVLVVRPRRRAPRRSPRELNLSLTERAGGKRSFLATRGAGGAGDAAGPLLATRMCAQVCIYEAASGRPRVPRSIAKRAKRAVFDPAVRCCGACAVSQPYPRGGRWPKIRLKILMSGVLTA